MKRLAFIFGIFLNHLGFSQTGFHVTYQRAVNNWLTDRDTAVAYTAGYYHLVFNDSISYSFYDRSDYRAGKGRTNYDASYLKRNLHHSFFYRPHQRELIQGVAFPKRRKPYFVIDTLPKVTLHIDSARKMFQGWRCRGAYAVISPGDTVFALLAVDYPYAYGPNNLLYFPYLPVEIYHFRYNYHLIARAITPAAVTINLPAAIPTVARRNWRPGGHVKVGAH